MESLPNLRKLLHSMGQCQKNGKDQLWYRVYGIYACSSMCIFMLPTIYFVTTLHRVDQFAAIIPVVVGIWNAAFKGTFFLIINKEVKSLLGNIQETFNAPLSNEIFPELLKKRPDKHYKSANSTSDYLVYGFRWVMGICGFATVTGPIVYTLYHFIVLGILTEDKIKVSIPVLFPWDMANMPTYVATTTIYAITIYLCVFTIASIDTFFLSVCVVFIGFFNDLMDMYAETDNMVNFSDQNSVFTDNKQRYSAMKANLNSCIEFHNNIDSQIVKFQSIIGPIVFAQYFFSLSQLGTLIFASIMIPGVTPDVVIFNITLIMACLTELLIYCHFGSELTSEAKKVSNAIYGCKWYKYHPNLRKYLLIAMCRSQKEVYVHGFYMVIASMETFSKLINLIASAFTILKSTVG